MGLKHCPSENGWKASADERVAKVINTALQSKPADGTHWTLRTIVQRFGWQFTKFFFVVSTKMAKMLKTVINSNISN